MEKNFILFLTLNHSHESPEKKALDLMNRNGGNVKRKSNEKELSTNLGKLIDSSYIYLNNLFVQNSTTMT